MKNYISLAGFHLALLPFSVAEAVAAINNFTASSSPPPGLVLAWGAASAGLRGEAGSPGQIRIKDACFEAGSLPAEVASGCHQALATCRPELPCGFLSAATSLAVWNHMHSTCRVRMRAAIAHSLSVQSWAELVQLFACTFLPLFSMSLQWSLKPLLQSQDWKDSSSGRMQLVEAVEIGVQGRRWPYVYPAWLRRSENSTCQGDPHFLGLF